MSAVERRAPTVNIVGRLEVQGHILDIGQVCQDWLVLREPCNLEPCAAKLIVTVKGVDKIQEIFLPHGISADSDVVHFF